MPSPSFFRDSPWMVDNLQQNGSAAFQTSTTITAFSLDAILPFYFSEA